jgi:hypothetical protein
MSSSIPMAYTWEGDAFRPLKRFQAEADRSFVIGETYRLAEIEERSDKTHKHEFAWLREAWLNLPDDQSERFPSPEHLRKMGLIKGGFCDQRQVVCASKAEAQRIAAFIKPMDPYALVTVKDAIVTVYTAQSQSRRAMDKATFQASKQAILDNVSGLIGVASEELAKARAA